MKKLASIIVSIVYLVLSTGVLVNLHYCQGEIESISVVTNNSLCCCATIDFDDNGCCKNEQLLVHLDNDEQIITKHRKLQEVFKFIEKDSFEKLLVEDDSIGKEYFTFEDISPPPKLGIWKTNCTFLFYG